MPKRRAPLLFSLALAALAACNPDPSAPTTPAVPMPELEASIANSTPEAATRGVSDKTWLWTKGGGPAQIHYSTDDGRDYVWVVGQRRIFVGDWRIAQDPNARGRAITKVCFRYPGSGVPALSEGWHCPEAGRLFYDMTERESGDPLRINGRSEAPFVLDKTPANLAEVQARVR
jgi:hypothetical protein